MSNMYCSIADVRSLTGVDISTISDADLTTIIQTASDEIDAYLLQFDLSGNTGGSGVSACKKLSQAGVIQRMWTDGTAPKYVTSGEERSQNDPETAIKLLRTDAYALLEQYKNSQIVRVHIRNRYVVRCN
jgi:hypothetical protein